MIELNKRVFSVGRYPAGEDIADQRARRSCRRDALEGRVDCTYRRNRQLRYAVQGRNSAVIYACGYKRGGHLQKAFSISEVVPRGRFPT